MSQRIAVLRSVTIVSLSSYVEFALGLVVSIWIARALGPDDFGRYAFIVWLCSWLITCSNNALTTSSTKFIAEVRGSGNAAVAAHITHRLEVLQRLCSLAVVGIFLVAALLIRPHDWSGALLPIVALIAVAVYGKASYAMLCAIAKGQERFEPEAIATVIVGIVTTVLVIAAAYVHAGLIAFIALFTVSCLALNLANRVLCRRWLDPSAPGPVPGDVRVRLRRHLVLTAVLVLIGSFKNRTIETFLLNTFSTTAAVGYFAIAGTLTRGAIQLFSVGLTATLLPYMAKSFGRGGVDTAARFLSESARFYWAIGLVVAGIGLVTTPGIVELLYGRRYEEAIPAIQATLVFGGLLLPAASLGAYQTVADHQDDRIRVTVGALIVNGLLGVALVPWLGLGGAVATYVGTRIAEMVLSIHYVRRSVASPLPAAPMLRLAVAGIVAALVAAAVVVFMPWRFAFLLAAIAFVVVFAPASVAARYWTESDYAMMATLGLRAGPPGRAFARLVEHARRGGLS
ncbi:MAG: oligosaccharide flippase family protein [Lysobacterales bacterium]